MVTYSLSGDYGCEFWGDLSHSRGGLDDKRRFSTCMHGRGEDSLSPEIYPGRTKSVHAALEKRPRGPAVYLRGSRERAM